MGYRQEVRHSTLTATTLVRFQLAQFDRCPPIMILATSQVQDFKTTIGKTPCCGCVVSKLRG